MEAWQRDPSEIAQLATRFGQTADILKGVSQDLNGYDYAIGSQPVLSSFHAITNNWWVERGRLEDEIRSAESALQAVASAYNSDESTIIQAASPGTA